MSIIFPLPKSFINQHVRIHASSVIKDAIFSNKNTSLQCVSNIFYDKKKQFFPKLANNLAICGNILATCGNTRASQLNDKHHKQINTDLIFFIHKMSKEYENVFIVAGPNDVEKYDVKKYVDNMSSLCKNVHFLNNDTHRLTPNTVLLGSSMFNKKNDLDWLNSTTRLYSDWNVVWLTYKNLNNSIHPNVQKVFSGETLDNYSSVIIVE